MAKRASLGKRCVGLSLTPNKKCPCPHRPIHGPRSRTPALNGFKSSVSVLSPHCPFPRSLPFLSRTFCCAMYISGTHEFPYFPSIGMAFPRQRLQRNNTSHYIFTYTHTYSLDCCLYSKISLPSFRILRPTMPVITSMPNTEAKYHQYLSMSMLLLTSMLCQWNVTIPPVRPPSASPWKTILSTLTIHAKHCIVFSVIRVRSAHPSLPHLSLCWFPGLISTSSFSPLPPPFRSPRFLIAVVLGGLIMTLTILRRV
ncbi:hypothetical protein B0T10DRAFT_145335 [Thelonectria olida]|uniref:Uncharacterized protein n=1 Tax=Thelonectria olida TaxID=1576542 RepID=A0A9P9AK98_9HYPO|nr:hypothetical protein B0T10DRAFT_145335 [Thelonectria olida]